MNKPDQTSGSSNCRQTDSRQTHRAQIDGGQNNASREDHPTKTQPDTTMPQDPQSGSRNEMTPPAPAADTKQDDSPGNTEATRQQTRLDPTRYGDWEKNGRCIDF